ncbi:MAG TPA: STAS domain-containing protein [Candidatus Binatia bacterium]|nr:STAS domain-containing protein [Candidatus Binatia bacterium]
MLRVDIESSRYAATLRCSGRVVLGVEAETLRCMAQSRPEARLVLDLRQVHTMDAAGLGLLVELHCWARAHARKLIVTNPAPRVSRLMELTRLESVLHIADSGFGHRPQPPTGNRQALSA